MAVEQQSPFLPKQQRTECETSAISLPAPTVRLAVDYWPEFRHPAKFHNPKFVVAGNSLELLSYSAHCYPAVSLRYTWERGHSYISHRKGSCADLFGLSTTYPAKVRTSANVCGRLTSIFRKAARAIIVGIAAEPGIVGRCRGDTNASLWNAQMCSVEKPLGGAKGLLQCFVQVLSVVTGILKPPL